MSRIADILQQEYKTKGVFSGATSALGKRALETMDIRNALFKGSGAGSVIGTKIFGKGYSATKRTGAEKSTSPINESLSLGDSPVLQELNTNMKLTAKNTMALPMMARDMNLMKLNIFKLVKLQGGSANTSKTDIFWQNSKTRESAYENTIGKMMGDGKLGKMSRALFVGRKERDGQTPETALYITGTKGEGEEDGSIVGTILSAIVLKRILTATLGFLTGPVGLSIIGGFGLYKIIEDLMDKNKDKEGVDLATKALGGGLDESQFGSEIMAAAEEGQRQREAEALKNRTASGPLERLPPTPLPETGAGGGRGFVNPELVKPAVEAVPSNAIMSASGPIRTGSGGFVTSGEPMTTPSPTSAPSTTPSAVSSASSTPSYIKTASEMIVKEEGLPKGGKAYYDPPGQKNLVSIGYGHQIKDYEYKSGFIQAGNESIPILGERGIDTVLSKEQSRKLLEMDLPKYEKAAAGPLGEAWDKLNDEQKASLISYAYNTGSTTSLVKKGLKEAILKGDFQEAGKIISEKGIRTAGGVENKTLVARRKHEGVMFASTSAPSATPSKPSTGTTLASASTSIADSKMALASGGKGNTIINNNSPTTVASASTPTSKSTPYQQEFYSSLVSSIAL